MNYIIKEILQENDSKTMTGKELINLYPDFKNKLTDTDIFNVYPDGSIDETKTGMNCIPALNDESEIIDWIVTVFANELLIQVGIEMVERELDNNEFSIHSEDFGLWIHRNLTLEIDEEELEEELKEFYHQNSEEILSGISSHFE